MTEQSSNEQTPTPQIVGAWFVLSMPSSRRIPWWAAQWLADGHDGPALRELAGLDGRDPHDVADLLPQALMEAGAPLPATVVDAANQVFDHLARKYLSGHADELQTMHGVDEIVIHNDYSNGALDLPLGRLYAYEDAWHCGWGPPQSELQTEIRQACLDQLASNASPASRRTQE